ncbi:hypothetical protein, partial [Acinetobacter baumannii]|uniref:hypothetical protein n=1 Tax=Acinetobacter baumannii TaxID=470 RepID=UPI000AA0B7D6
RMVIEKDLKLSLPELLVEVTDIFGNLSTDVVISQLIRFLQERLTTYLRTELDGSASEVEATLSVNADEWHTVVK